MTTDLTPQVIIAREDRCGFVAAIAEDEGFQAAVSHVLEVYSDDLPRLMAEQYVAVCQLQALLMQIKPVVDNPSLILGSLPPGIRALIG